VTLPSTALAPKSDFIYRQISHLVLAGLIEIQQDYPHCFQPQYQAVSLEAKEAILLDRLTAFFQQIEVSDKLLILVKKAMGKFVEADFFETYNYRQFLSKVERLIQLNLQQQVTYLSEEYVYKMPARVMNSDGIALLLLDTENIELSQEAESWVQDFCQYPIRSKLAFGNWRRLGNRDVDLHQRGYQMVHVPDGKNSADFKMTAVGSSYLLHSPNVKEAVICSSDHDLDNLQHALQCQGLRVHYLYQETSRLILCSYATQQVEAFQLAEPVLLDFPSREVGLDFIKTFLKTFNGPVALGIIGSEFAREFQVSLGQFGKHYRLGKTAKSLFASHPDFVIHRSGVNKQWEVALKPSNSPQTTIPFMRRFGLETEDLSLEGLGQLLRDTLAQVLSDRYCSEISLSVVVSVFRQEHGQSLKQLLKALRFSGNVPDFFQTCDTIITTWNGHQWMLSLPPEAPVTTDVEDDRLSLIPIP
jgi:hypothetical protein